MNVGMVVYSQTGNTHSVAASLKEKLVAAGHTVTMERLQTSGDPTQGQEVQLQALPSVEPYDTLVVAAPVHAFSLSVPMKTCLNQLASLQGKRVVCLVTQAFPFAWLGGNRAIRQMTRLCGSKGATVCGSGIVNWSRKSRDQQISQVVDRLSGCL
jgi:hypothetical protein